MGESEQPPRSRPFEMSNGARNGIRETRKHTASGTRSSGRYRTPPSGTMSCVSLNPPDPLPSPRLSDQDRERVVEVLQTSCGAGRLTLDEFSERVDAAYQAVTL